MLIVVLPLVAMANIDGNMNAIYGTQLSLSYTHIDTQTKIKSCIYDFFLCELQRGCVKKWIVERERA